MKKRSRSVAATAHQRALDGARWQAVLRSAQDAIISIDVDAKITLFNPAAEAMFGFSSEDVLGQNVAVLMPEPYRRDHDGYVRAYQRTGVPRAIGRVRYVDGLRRSGERFPIELSVSEAQVDGEVLYTAIIRDVTEIVRTHAAMRARETQQAAVAELGQRALADGSVGTLIEYATTIVRRTLGVELAKVLQYVPEHHVLRVIAGEGWRADVLGATTSAAIPSSHAAAVLSAEQPMIMDDFEREPDFESSPFLREHGVVSGIGVAIAGRTHPFGVLTAYTTTHRRFSADDITFLQSIAHVVAATVARDDAEKELFEARRAAQQRERLADIGAITAKIVHDLGNPLAAISMQAQLLQRRARRSEFAPVDPVLGPVDHILGTVRRLQALTREFNDFARDQRIDRRPIPVAELLLDLAALWRPLAEARDIEISVTAEPELPPLRADEDKLRRVLDNLIKNAIDAIDTGPGHIVVAAELRTPERICLRVADSGSGVPESLDVFRLFETTKREGTGIGLAVAKQIVHAHGGMIEHRPNEPHGTVFEIELPLSGLPASAVQPLTP